MRILVAPDKFKGTASAQTVAESIRTALGDDHEILIQPLADGGEGTIEALEKSFWYGFTDDMIIRIEKLITNDIIINVRSASRIGRSDFGKNSKRIKSYFVLMQ